jgi:hypothetical protein
MCLVPAAPGMAAHQRVLARVEAKVVKPGPRLPASFLGFSYEYDRINRSIGLPSSRGANPIAVTLMRRFAAFGSGVPVTRLGGGSMDQIYLKGQGEQPLPGQNIGITRPLLDDVTAYQLASGSPLIVGVNLLQNRPDLAARFVKLMLDTQPPGSIRDFEVGNEPDFYTRRPLVPGQKARPPSWGPVDYLNEFAGTAASVRDAAPQVELAASGFLGDSKWEHKMGGVLRALNEDGTKLVTIHRYPTNNCAGTTGRFKASVKNLIAATSVDGWLSNVAPLVKIARKFKQRVRMTESNSAACGGRHGVSDAFASALWATDWLFLWDAVGLDGVDFHTSGFWYTPFTTFHSNGMHGSVVRPLYYAMLVFAEATSHRARILPSAYGGGRGSKGKVHTWATYDGVDHVVRVVITNKSNRSGYALVHVPGARGKARLKRLNAPSAGSLTHVTWGGQAFASPTFDGKLVGKPRVQFPKRRKGSQFRIKMPKVGVALLTVPVRRR